MNLQNSSKLYEKAKNLMPGGVNSPVRAFGAVNGDPVFFKKASGARFEDVDGNEYIDYCMSWGPLILGHSHPEVLNKVKEVAENGLSFGAPNEYEVLLSEKVLSLLPGMDKVRFVSSGTEAVMSAVRVARGYTKREKIVKFDGGYHGHADSFLVSAGSGLKTFGAPSSPGVPETLANDTMVLKFNETEAFCDFMKDHGDEIAAVIVEPLPGNAGLHPLTDEFLRALRSETKKYGSVLICDEVISGFRLNLGSYAQKRGIEPDMITLGKIIGGGLPVGAYLGKNELMDQISPVGPVYQAGTLSGNPVSMAAGLETLNILEKENPYGKMSETTEYFESSLKEIFTKADLPHSSFREGSLLWFYLSSENPFDENNDSEKAMERFKKLHFNLLENGVYLPPSGWEILFLSMAHTKEIVDKTLDRVRAILN
jgi:glutamate-1-semialdehyde 2,1-aminomutase